MAKTKTKKPTGLTLSRNKRTFSMGWGCASKDHDGGQELKFYEYYNSYNQYWAWSSSSILQNDISISASARAATKNISFSSYYPTTRDVLTKVEFLVRGHRKGSKYSWSSWASKSFSVSVPYDPIISEALDQSGDQTTTFSWTSSVSDSDGHPFYDYEWETVLTVNGADPPWGSPDYHHVDNGIDPDTGGSDTGSHTVNGASIAWSVNKGSGAVTISENASIVYANSTDTYIRWFRVRARGAGGASSWVQERHVYGMPAKVTWVYGTTPPYAVKTTGNSSWSVGMSWTSVSGNYGSKNRINPIDYLQAQYCIQSPLITSNISNNTYSSTLSFNPNEASWTDAPGGVVWTVYGFAAYSFSLSEDIPDNKTLYVRVNTVHDRKTTYGDVIEVSGARRFLSSPSGLLINDVDGEEHRILITKPQNNTDIPNSFTAIYYRSKEGAAEERVVGIVPWGEESGTMIIQCPSWSDTDAPGLGMKTFVGNYTPITPTSTAALPDNYTVFNRLMESNGVDWLAGAIPIPPKLEIRKYAPSPYDTIEASWDWRWTEANGAELSWADRNDAWSSTNEPSTYTISGIHASIWNITGLEPTTWHVRCRLLRENSDGVSYGSYSKIRSVTLSTNPETPGLTTDTPTIKTGDSFTIYWNYFNEDGTEPESAEIGEATVSDGNVTYPDAGFRTVSKNTYDQKETLNAADLEWEAGSTHYLVVRVKSISGQISVWSKPLAINVVNPITASISGTIISTGVLTSLPFTVTVSGVGTDGIASAMITRKDSYSIVRPELRPDEAPEDGFAGETIAYGSISGSGDIVFSRENLIGHFDDGATYIIVGNIVDSYGQTSTTDPHEFTVSWSHHALMPSATITIDEDNLAAIIDLDAVQGAVSGDKVDIYRLSADKPELIVKGGTMGTTYVDPYPTLGKFGGHRIVYITKDGDYITDDRTLAMVDYPDEDDEITTGYIEYFGAVIDFGSEQVRLPYNIELSNKWSKDFTEVKYLGGSVQGYWNRAVERTGSIKTSVVIEEDEVGPETMRTLRRLAMWPGICHVRTPDGSSYAANIDVSEDRESQWVRRLASVTLDITRVDVEQLDGMTMREWQDITE